MDRVLTAERPNLKSICDANGFTFATSEAGKYWDESRAYVFTLQEIEENIEAPTAELYNMCLKAVEHVVRNPKLMTRLDIPEIYHSAIIQSWDTHQAPIYGRFDFSYDGDTVKLLEFNADTPTSLYESGVFQWQWLEHFKDRVLNKSLDQFNMVHEKLISTFKDLHRNSQENVFHFAGTLDSDEDRLTVEYMAECAFQAGFEPFILDIRDVHESQDGSVFMDTDDNVIHYLFKLYPLEYMFREDFGPLLVKTKTQIFEPLWKGILSNKGILPILWELFPNHPNLLEAHFVNDLTGEDYPLRGDWVTKPLLSREGANVHVKAQGLDVKTNGEYGEGAHIIQRAAVLPRFGKDYTLIGSWVIGGEPAGICIREDHTPITGNLSRFVPHYIKG